MQVARTVAELRDARRDLRGPVVFVPTMGALHEGHLSLIAIARRHATLPFTSGPFASPGGSVVASVFVNPAQFNDPADLERYPRTLDDDLARLEEAGVDLVFAPEAEEIYPPGEAEVAVDVPALSEPLEGRHRPGHFRGVCRVVLKLFNIVRPDAAVFGMKDFQQLRVIEGMVEGLNLPVAIIRGPTVRDADGLALSSRNARLSPAARRRALAIPRALEHAASLHASGERSAAALEEAMRRVLQAVDDQRATAGGASPPAGGHGAGAGEGMPFALDYAAVADARTLQPLREVGGPALLAIAATVAGVRLIDNRLIGEDAG